VAEIRRINAEADERTARAWSKEAERMPLTFEIDYTDSVMIDFEGYEYRPEKSDVTGGMWHRYGTTPVSMRIPMFNRQKVTLGIPLPQQYWIPPQWTDVIDRLRAHGIEMTRLDEPKRTYVERARLTHPVWVATPFEGRHTVSFETTWSAELDRTYPAGTVVVDMAQPRAKIAAHLLEPEAPDALAQWGFFDTIFESKEYLESYVVEAIARDMLRDDDDLAREFKEAMQDTSLAHHPKRVRDWFYQRSRYAETRVGEYPIVRVWRANVRVH